MKRRDTARERPDVGREGEGRALDEVLGAGVGRRAREADVPRRDGLEAVRQVSVWHRGPNRLGSLGRERGLVDHPGGAQVDDLALAVQGAHHVAGLQIAMDDPELVNRLQSRADVQSHLGD